MQGRLNCLLEVCSRPHQHFSPGNSVVLVCEYFVIQDGSVGYDSADTNNGYDIEPLPGLETIFEELLREDGYVLIITYLRFILGSLMASLKCYFSEEVE